jgi:hypothetical protein
VPAPDSPISNEMLTPVQLLIQGVAIRKASTASA